MKGQRGKAGEYVTIAKKGLLNRSVWRRSLEDYPTSLICQIREELSKRVPNLREKFNSNSRYFGFCKGEDEDRAYIYVQKKNLSIHLCISRDYAKELRKAGFEIRYVNNFQGRAGWLTGWRVPHSAKNLRTVMKWLCMAFERRPKLT